MRRYNWNTLEREKLNPQLHRKCVHTGNLTVARIELAKGVVVPEHRHANEQVTMLQSGKLRFFMEGTQVDLEPGDILEIPPHATHKVEALEDSVAVDLFAPRREDWISGDDAYLRQPV